LGILSKFFGKKPAETIRELELEIEKLKIKSNSELISLVGTDGKLRGLPLIYSANNEAILKKYCARLGEIFRPIENIVDEKIIQDVIINYKDFFLVFKPILRDIGILAIITNKSYISSILQWVDKNNNILKALFPEHI